MYVYLDLVIALNFLVDLLLLLGTNRLSGFPPGWRRLIPAAALGGLYGGACLLPGFNFLGNMVWRLIFLGCMAVIAFGWNAVSWKRCGVFLLLSMAMGGISMNLGRGDALGLLAAAVLVWLLCCVGFGGSIGSKTYVPLVIRKDEKCIRLTALRDSGNTLRDPVTGEQVLIIDSAAAEELTGLSAHSLASPLDTLGTLPGLRLIPYRTVGQSGGFLLGMRFKDVTVGNWKGAAVVAFAPQEIGRGEGYQALTGGAVQ